MTTDQEKIPAVVTYTRVGPPPKATTQYIRKDIVDGLVVALEAGVVLINVSNMEGTRVYLVTADRRDTALTTYREAVEK